MTRHGPFSRLRSLRGATITELMVATVIMSVGVLGLFGSFRFISRSIFISRATTLATNLGQERIEALKNLSYYSLLITTNSASNTNFSPAIAYDTVNYPPEIISIGGINYTRYTYVTMADVTNGVVNAVSANYPDSGLKQITVNIVWKDGQQWKKWSLTNLLENPYVNPLDATITGTISKSAGGALSGAVVTVEQNSDWTATSNGTGGYNFKVYHGTYTVRASSAGYYDAVSAPTVVNKGGSATINLAMSQIATGTIAGNVWFNSDLVFSQVVANTRTIVADGANANVEYVELFNPTTFPIDIGSAGGGYPKPVNILYYNDDMIGYAYLFWCDGGSDNCPHSVRVSTYVPPLTYYLIANASFFCINNTWKHADAYYYKYDKTYPDFDDADIADFVPLNKAVGLYIYRYPTGASADVVGWADNNSTPPAWEGSYIPNHPSYTGLPQGGQIVRVSSPAAGTTFINLYGRAYDSNNNAGDFLYPYNGGFDGFVHPPYSVADGSFTIVSGKPAYSALVASADTNSGAAQAYRAYKTSATLSLPYATYSLPGVSTGTWSVSLASSVQTSAGSYTQYGTVITNVAVTQGQVTPAPGLATVPASLPVAHAMLAGASAGSGGSQGYVKGVITNTDNVPITNITVQGGGSSQVTGTNGVYFLTTTSGTVSIIANPNNANPAYIQQIGIVNVTQGAISTQDFSLGFGGRITGYVTTGTTPLSNQAVVALLGGSQVGSATTDASGTFTFRNISTGTYTIQPVLESGQDSSPNSHSTLLGSTGTVFSTTFTVSGAFGRISGTVSDASGLLTSGALLVASTSTISSTPPTIAGSSAPALTPYYMVSSRADGSYVLPVRGGATYYLSVYVPTILANDTVTTTTKTYSGIIVSPSASTTRTVTIP